MKRVTVPANDVSGLLHSLLKCRIARCQINPMGRLNQEKASSLVGMETAYGLLWQHDSEGLSNLADLEFEHLGPH